ncbi:MAG: CoA-binding protein [Methylobacteriaceae bacterium]|jgi:predicted CoA-binding protein|nr:CoA-binding protein [Methylobacteriaceae bacterium]
MYFDYDDDYLTAILKNTRSIALVGASANPERPSNFVMKVLLQHGLTIYPVNPGTAGKTIHGQLVYPNLAAIPFPVDTVDLFVASDRVSGIVDEALALHSLPKCIWMQLGVWDEDAAARAEAKGVKVVMNHCIKIEILRLGIRYPNA